MQARTQSNLFVILTFFTLNLLFVGCSDTPPTCTILAPTDAVEIEQGSVVLISVDAEDTDGNISEVKFYIDEVGVGFSTEFPYEFEWNTENVDLGKHLILAKARDDNGNDTEDNIIIEIVNTINKPTVVTHEASEVTVNKATLNGEIITNGKATITERGFYWSTTNIDPDQNEQKVINTDEATIFTYQLMNLSPNTTYYYRTFATNSKGSSSGEVLSFKTLEENKDYIPTDSFIDPRDNNSYKTVQIGKQTWMAENLAYLPSVNAATEQSYTDPKYYVQYYQGNSIEEAKASFYYPELGVLYNFEAATNACPIGWHLPSTNEWEQLAQFISNDNGGYEHKNDVWENVGKHLKADYSWVDFVKGHGTDDYGFKAISSGYRRIYEGGFYYMNENAYWWSSTNQGQNSSFYYALFYDQDYLLKYPDDNMYGFSIRCVKD